MLQLPLPLLLPLPFLPPLQEMMLPPAAALGPASCAAAVGHACWRLLPAQLLLRQHPLGSSGDSAVHPAAWLPTSLSLLLLATPLPPVLALAEPAWKHCMPPQLLHCGQLLQQSLQQWGCCWWLVGGGGGDRPPAADRAQTCRQRARQKHH